MQAFAFAGGQATDGPRRCQVRRPRGCGQSVMHRRIRPAAIGLAGNLVQVKRHGSYLPATGQRRAGQRRSDILRPFRLPLCRKAKRHCLHLVAGFQRVCRAVLPHACALRPVVRVFADGAFLDGDGDLAAAVGVARGVAHGPEGRSGVACVRPVVLGREGDRHQRRAAPGAVFACVE
ncbi:MAG: hypothetical protein ACK55I_16225, partial [bacterium]